MSDKKDLVSKLIKQVSILASVVESASELNDISESSELQLEISRRLRALKTDASQARATFILKQNEAVFNANREIWGVPSFGEDLVTLGDFKDGFLWRFRAHTTSWAHNQLADEWFYTSLEARSVTRYEFWDCDDGPDKVNFVLTGNYKSILQELLDDHVHEVLISPAFSSEELCEYIDNFSEDEEDYALEEVIEDYISRNPNYSSPSN